jgi:hypothetical protein
MKQQTPGTSVKRVQVEGNIEEANIGDVNTGGKFAAGVVEKGGAP